MYNLTLILLIGIVAALTVAVIVLTFFNIHNQQQMQKKNDAIIREVRQNMELRDELRKHLIFNI